MTLFLRDANNKTVVDIELYRKYDEDDLYRKNGYIELNSVICIDNYSELLINNLYRKEEIIQEFHQISELREWLWERYFVGRQNTDKEYANVLKIVEDKLKHVATKFGLFFVTD